MMSKRQTALFPQSEQGTGVKGRTARGRLLRLLSDLNWHHRKELEVVAGNRYGARLMELRRLGYDIQKRKLRREDGYEYALISLERGEVPEKKVKVYLTPDGTREILAAVSGGTGVLSELGREDIDALRGALRSYSERAGRL